MARMLPKKKANWSRYPVRRGQLIAPFGIGAMVDYPGESLMVAGLDEWNDEQCPEVLDERLASRLGVQTFRMPAAVPEDGEGADIPAVRFPLWHQCPKCHRLSKAAWNDFQRPRCAKCTKSKWGVPMIPLRFVVACDAGHISDFPWVLWAHRNDGEKLRDAKPCEDPQLILKASNRADLSGLVVRCENCKTKPRSLAGASREGGLSGLPCPGDRPWLGPQGNVKNCGQAPTMVQRGASNVYFAEVVSSILIPPFSSRYYALLSNAPMWKLLTQGLKPGQEPDPGRVRDIASAHEGLDPAVLADFVRLKLSGELNAAPNQPEIEYRRSEYRALINPGKDDEQFAASRCDTKKISGDVGQYLGDLVCVDRLAETQALAGTYRLEGTSEFKVGGPEKRGLSLEPKNWLPANRVYGEGIFLTLDAARVQEWSGRRCVQVRTRALSKACDAADGKRGRTPRLLPPKFFLLHSFAHILIRQLSFECGYGSSSLRERLYCSEGEGKHDNMTGMLIYTAAGDCEGTLGGLVRQADPKRFGRLVADAIATARWCSSDPLCMEATSQGADGLNKAACHACLLLPETSCEEGNRLLDRALLVGTDEEAELGFFWEIAQR